MLINWTIDHRPWTMADGSLIRDLLFLQGSLKKAIIWLITEQTMVYGLWSIDH
jgi:hypothetical protein